MCQKCFFIRAVIKHVNILWQEVLIVCKHKEDELTYSVHCDIIMDGI